MSSCSSWGAGLPATTLRPSARCFAACYRYRRSSVAPLAIASPTKGRRRSTLRRKWARRCAREKTPSTRCSNTPCSTTSRTAKFCAKQSLRSAHGRDPRDLPYDARQEMDHARRPLRTCATPSRTVSVAVLKEVSGKINANQQAILLALKAAPEGRMRVDELRDSRRMASRCRAQRCDAGETRHRRNQSRKRRTSASRD